MSRKVTVVSTQANDRQEVQTSATTWGELKGEISSMINGDMKVTVRETRVNLEHEDAELPAGDFTIFLFPNKVKSGWDL
tara:strand:+ start:8447 stop:8683 length:237 start_codon:yes stop_codon:yes gene_type:complete